MRRLRGMRDKATTDAADYWMMVKEGNRMVATPIDEWSVLIRTFLIACN